MMDEGHTFDVMYLDFVKAFDAVNHRFLLVKMKSFGPLLFLFFVYDLPDVLEALTLRFADDVKIVTRRTHKMNLHSYLTAAWDRSKK